MSRPSASRDPHAVVDGFADGAIQLLAGLERARMRLHFVEHLVERVDDHADLVVGHLLRAEGVVALLDDLPRHVGHGFHRPADHAVQPARGEQGGDEADDHHRAEHAQVGAHAPFDVVLRAQVDSAEHLAALAHRPSTSRRARRRCARRAASAGTLERRGVFARPRVLRESAAVGRVERGGADGFARLQRDRGCAARLRDR